MKKIMFLVSLTVLLLIGSVSLVYAAELPSLPDDLPYAYVYVTVREDIGYYFLFNSDNPISASESDNFFSVYMESTYYIMDYDDGEWSVYASGKKDYCFIPGGHVSLYSNHDIYNYNDGTLFFRGAPLGMKEEILAEIIQPEIVLQEIVTLLPIAIPVLVGWMALWKALQLLSMLLRRA